ncbi:hypothetical protein [Halorientalis sp. IM1011]|uniref:hypothetical protein n=1 Tax=Halorientalis sp. IM1011 TaxID=1932360 RepID=UPI0012F7BB04|nr:hypothetical protein [Halorientalis sp. IM1011]
MSQEFHEATTEQVEGPSEDKSVFHEVDHLRELKPGYFPDLITHPETSIKICHDGRELLAIEDPTGMEITRPRMTTDFGKKRIKFRLDTVFEVVDPEDDGDDENEEEDTEDNDDTTTNKDGYDTEGKTVLTLNDG